MKLSFTERTEHISKTLNLDRTAGPVNFVYFDSADDMFKFGRITISELKIIKMKLVR